VNETESISHVISEIGVYRERSGLPDRAPLVKLVVVIPTLVRLRNIGLRKVKPFLTVFNGKLYFVLALKFLESGILRDSIIVKKVFLGKYTWNAELDVLPDGSVFRKRKHYRLGELSKEEEIRIVAYCELGALPVYKCVFRRR
jgi:hypothetical protein